MSQKPAILCRDLRKRYDPKKKDPVDALVGLDLEVRAGECFGLLGPNGAGKTTTVEILEGLLAPTSGEVEVLGMRWGRDDQAIRERIGVSLQETRLTDKLTVMESVRMFRSFHPTGLEPAEVLEAVDLGEKAASWVEKLSGGQRQRLAVACALVGEPDLLFFDEPTTGLDPQARRDLWQIVRDQRDLGRTTLLTTHYMDEAERLCDRVAVIDKGKVIALGSPAQLIQQVGGDQVIEFALGNGQVGAESSEAPTPTDPTPDAAMFGDLPSVMECRREDDGYVLTTSEPHRCIPALIQRLERNNLELARLTTRHVSLEDVFVSLTGRHLTDEERGD